MPHSLISCLGQHNQAPAVGSKTIELVEPHYGRAESRAHSCLVCGRVRGCVILQYIEQRPHEAQITWAGSRSRASFSCGSGRLWEQQCKRERLTVVLSIVWPKKHAGRMNCSVASFNTT